VAVQLQQVKQAFARTHQPAFVRCLDASNGHHIDEVQRERHRQRSGDPHSCDDRKGATGSGGRDHGEVGKGEDDTKDREAGRYLEHSRRPAPLTTENRNEASDSETNEHSIVTSARDE
jgi:hypothetical protein